MKLINIPCVILCGGKSSRMGQDKSMLEFGGMKMVEYMYQKCQKIFSSVYLSCKDGEKFKRVTTHLLVENEGEFAPIFGLANAMEKLESERIFVVSVDLPFLQKEHCQKICSYRFDVVYAKTPKHSHYLCGVYHCCALPIMQEQIQKEDYKISTFVSKLSSFSVVFEDEEVFANLNTMQDYQEALRRLEHGK